MLVGASLLAHGHVRQRITAAITAARRVVVAGVDLEVVGECEDFLGRVIEGFGVAVREIAAGGTHVRVEERVAGEDVS